MKKSNLVNIIKFLDSRIKKLEIEVIRLQLLNETSKEMINDLNIELESHKQKIKKLNLKV